MLRSGFVSFPTNRFLQDFDLIRAVIPLGDLILNTIRICYGSAGLYLALFIDYIFLTIDYDLLISHSILSADQKPILIKASVLNACNSISLIAD